METRALLNLVRLGEGACESKAVHEHKAISEPTAVLGRALPEKAPAPMLGEGGPEQGASLNLPTAGFGEGTPST